MPDEFSLDVIAVGAHPDDCEIGCGGTLASLVAQGYRVGIIDLTDGEPTPLCPSPEVRLREASEAKGVLGVHHRVIFDLPNRRLFDSFEARVQLATEFRRYRPSIVLSLGAKTPLASPDHWQAMQITEAAVFYSRLSKWDEHFNGMPTHKINHLLYYSLAFESAFERNANAVIHDISETLEQKLNSVRCYRTQFPVDKEYLFERVKNMALAYGAAAGFVAGEQLTMTRAIGCRNLVPFLNG